MDFLVLDRLKITPEKKIFDTPGKGGIGREYIFKKTVLFANFADEDAPILLDQLSFDLTGMAFYQQIEIRLTSDDLVPDLRNAHWTKRVGLARKTQRRV
jgi:hypothetical protein